MRVVVVGGGIAGVSAAAELARSAGVDTVTLVEAEATLAHHTTGRSAAMYLPGYGNPVVRALTAASRADLDALSAEAGTPILTPRTTMWVGGPDELDALDSLAAGNEAVRRVDGAEVVARWPRLRPDRIGGGVVDDGGSDIDVGVLHQAYVRRLARAGGIVERTARVDAVTRPAGGGWRVTAGDRSWEADLLVDAAGAWADEVAVLAGVAPVGLRPLRRTLFTSPVGPDVETGPLVADVHDRWYVRVDAGVALVSPADETPSPPCDARPEDVDVARALEAVDAVTTLGLRSVRTAWAGLRTFAPDRSPVVGPDPAEPTFVWSAGQGGYGLQMAPALARAVASLALGAGMPADVPLTPAEVGAARFAQPDV